ncbi:hypothetical protein BDP27DRAFT_1430172 [Rhodocollybia butyracea]|uniref:Uncharacterized protein n=1 Tax=Rhodocollybia butyracea TaxID=206335 RepID=A0A9P5TZ16_9AGAR|nr:hypothetical protein BDP27DRAFT_1430172 [Rhodocollybia butyracea]
MPVRPTLTGASSSLLQIHPPTPARNKSIPLPDDAFASNFCLSHSPSAAPTSQSNSRYFCLVVMMGPPSGFNTGNKSQEKRHLMTVAPLA